MFTYTAEQLTSMAEALNVAVEGACRIATDLHLGELLEQGTASPNSRRYVFEQGIITVALRDVLKNRRLMELVTAGGMEN
jgi:hypothetical protein